MSGDKGTSPEGDRASLASPQAPPGLGHTETIPSADGLLIYEALRFYFWAAGQGISPDSTEACLEPEEGFWQYTLRTGDEEWETVAERYRINENPRREALTRMV